MRYFWDTEEEKIYSEEELVKVFCDLMAEDDSYKDSTFNDFLRDATGKNGSLVEVKKPLAKSEVEEIYNATAEFENAIIRLSEALGNVSDESFNDFLTDSYPFLNSFYDVRYDVENWCGRIYRCAGRFSRND